MSPPIQEIPRDARSVVIGAYAPVEMKRALIREATRTGRSLSAELRLALSAHLGLLPPERDARPKP